MTVLRPGELLTAIRIPATWAGAQFYFEKVRDRQVWDFPLVNVASAMKASGGTIQAARIAVGAVAARPLRLTAVEAAVAGQAAQRRDGDAGRRAGDRGRAAAALQRLQDPADAQSGQARHSRHRAPRARPSDEDAEGAQDAEAQRPQQRSSRRGLCALSSAVLHSASLHLCVLCFLCVLEEALHGWKTSRPELHHPGSRRQGHRQSEILRRLPRRGDAVREAPPQPDAARARHQHRRQRGAGHALASRRSSPQTICRRSSPAPTSARASSPAR